MFGDEGRLGHLADHECEHGSLPDDPRLDCVCWPVLKPAPDLLEVLASEPK